MIKAGSHCRIRFEIDPFSGDKGIQIKCSLKGATTTRWDTWSWSGASLRILCQNSSYRPRVYPMAPVK